MIRDCVVCGKDFPARDEKSRDTCSQNCYMKRRYHQQKAKELISNV